MGVVAPGEKKTCWLFVVNNDDYEDNNNFNIY